MKIIDIQQGTPEWIEYRQGGIGSSDIACIMGCGFGTKSDLFYEKSGFKSKFVNDAMRRGSEFEQEARCFVEMRTGLTYTPICAEHDEISFFRASLDGYNEIDNSIIEIKVPTDPKAFKAAQDGMIPDRYTCQMQWQLLVSGADMVLFCVYDPIIKDVAIVEVLPDLVVQQALTEEGMKFWEEFERGVLNDDKEEVLEFEGPEYLEIKERYARVQMELKIKEAELDRLKQEIYDLADDGSFKFHGLNCIKTKGRASYDYKKMEKDGIDLQKYAKFGGHYYKITLDK